MADFCESAFQEHGRTKRARLSTVDELQANTESHHSDERNLFKLITDGSEMYASQTVAQAKEHGESTKYYSHIAIGHLDAIKQSASSLTNNDIKEVSSGNTPRKRKWQYNDEWALTKSRDELLKAWNQCKTSTTKMGLENEDDELPTPPTTFAGTENLDGSESHRDVKSESSDVDVPPKPLMDSRKRNHISTRASRRVR